MIVKFDKDIYKNNNTGLLYEFAIFLSIIQENGREFVDTISKREDFSKIIAMSNKISNDLLLNTLSNYGIKDINKIELTTQNDSVGPSDIVINDIFGLSIKYNTKCNSNPTGKDFLKERDIDDYNKDKIEFFTNYISEKNPFRSRKTKSKSLNLFINNIKEKVISNWNNNILDKDEKLNIINKLYHINSPIDYIILRLNSKGKIFIDDTIFNFDINNITLSNPENSYVLFHYNDKIIGKMQVKFNNGVFERYEGKGSPDFIIDGNNAKMGNAISSWNFSLNK